MDQKDDRNSGKGKEIRLDGYKNLLTKYGTQEDSSERYRFESDGPVTDIELSLNYEENGLFAKIIDIPAEDAVSSGFSYGLSDSDIEKFINTSLNELRFEEKASTALKWARLYGGALGVMLVDDGADDLSMPLDWDNIKGIDDILIYERPLVTPDYNSLYDKRGNGKYSKFGMPEFYNVSPIYGKPFRVHESRCLIFKNNVLPSITTNTEYRFFGIPEYKRIHKALQETVTSHGMGPKILDRAVQAVHKIKDLAALMATEDGEQLVLDRLNLVDMARGLFNTIAIDADGEDYDFKSMSFAGIKDVIDTTCNMLSAVSNIPQTKLFGRSPAGENATGKGDMENYYSFVENIQKLNLRCNMETVVDVILISGKRKGMFDEIPEYELTFNPLWNLSDAEQAGVDQTKAQTELTKAQTAQIYVDMQAINADEVRDRLAESGEFTINDILNEEDTDWNGLSGDLPDRTAQEESAGTYGTAHTAQSPTGAPGQAMESDSEEATGCGVIVIKDGKVLVGTRKDNGQTCGPGGHIENGETPEEAAAREAREEFGIYVAELIPLGVVSGMPDIYSPSQIFLCTEFYGTPRALSNEMGEARFEAISDIWKQDLFLPFEKSLLILNESLRQADSENADDWITVNGQHIEVNENGQQISGNPKVLGETESGKGESGRNKNKNPEKQKKELQESQNGGKIYAEEKIDSFIAAPKTLGDTTHREKYDDFIRHGVEVRSLGKGSQKKISYEDGGGYRVGGAKDGKSFSYHPKEGSHHGDEYYKLSGGSIGINRYDMNGDPMD